MKEQKPKFRILRQDGSDYLPNKSEYQPDKASNGCLNGCLAFFVASLMAFVIGVGVCMGGFVAMDSVSKSSGAESSAAKIVALLQMASLFVPLIIFIIVFNSMNKK